MTSRNPLGLPRFTMVSGPRIAGIKFTSELIRRTGGNSIYFDLEEPIINATMHSLYHHTERYNHDPNDVDTWLKYIPHSTKLTYADWIAKQKAHYRALLGDDILARIFLHRYHIDAWENLSPAMIIRDLDSAADAKAIVAKYGTNDCVHVALNIMGSTLPLPNCFTIGITAKLDSPADQVEEFITCYSKTYQARGIARTA